jgi:hypothetical protein
MNNLNWLQVTGVITVVSLVLISLFMFTGLIRRLPEVRSGQLINLILVLLATVAGVYYITKTNYGVKPNKEEQNKNNSNI